MGEVHFYLKWNVCSVIDSIYVTGQHHYQYFFVEISSSIYKSLTFQMVSTLPCKAEISRAEQQSYFSGILFEYLLDCSINWLTLTMHLMLFVVIVSADLDAMETFVVVADVLVVVDADSVEMRKHSKLVMVMDRAVSVG